MKEVKIESVKRFTKKALLVVIEGNEFWIQRRWLRDDNTLTPAGVKNYEAEVAKNASAGVASSKDRYVKEQNEIIYNISDADYATDKAVLFKNIVKVTKYNHVTEMEYVEVVEELKWIPKSACLPCGGITRNVWNRFEWKVA